MAATGYNVQTTADTISFRDQTTGVASISYDHASETLSISQLGTGAVSFGDTASDLYIGDGVNSVDLIFEVDGAVKGDTDVTLTLGATDSDILIASPIATLTGSQLATESWVLGQVVDSAPSTLNTLNELAAALGDDANYSTTISTALGNRLRVDINNQGLSSTDQSNARTNLGLGTAATSASTAFAAASHTHAASDITSGTLADARIPSLAASKITSGTFADARIPSLAASKITSGTLNNARLDNTILRHRGTLDLTSSSGGNNGLPFDDAHTETRVAEYGTRLLSYTGASATMLTISTGGSASVFQIGAHYNGNDFYMRTRTDSSNWQTWKKLWHSGNDGTGSGLDADLLDGAQPSVSASNNTIVKRHSSGYIYANYINTTANDVSSGVTRIMVETGNDGFMRHGDKTSVLTYLNVDDGADVTPSWVPSTNPNYLTGNQTITLSGDVSGSGTTSISVSLAADSVGSAEIAANAVGASEIAASAVGASELNVSGNGTTAQFLRSDGDGTFTWATPPDNNTTYSAGNGISLSGTTFSVAAGGGLTQTSTGLSHTDTSSQSSVNNSNGTVIQDITLDTYGHITSIGSANLDSRYYTETESDTRFLRANADDSITNSLTIDQVNGGNLCYNLSDNGVYIPHPKGASYHTTGNSHTGAIAIKFPTASQSSYDMLSFHVDIFDYMNGPAGESVSLFVFGYINGPTSWVNTGAHVVSDRTDRDYTVRFATASDRHIVYIGETGHQWNYLQIVVRDFQAGYSANHTHYNEGWDIDVNVTSFETVRQTSSANYPVSKQLKTARNIALTGAVTGNANFDGSANISIATTATADPTLTLSGDASGSATFTNLGNATLSVAVANDSHTHDGRYYTETETNGFLNLKANLASPALTGNPTAPTQAANNNSTRIATTAYVQTELSALIGGAPAALDTLNELAAAIDDDASYASSITTALAAKAPLASPTFTGTVTTPNLTIGSGNKIKFANNDYIRYDDANGVGRFHFDSDGGTNNSSVQAATFVGALSGNASTATKWATARTLSLTGEVTGSVSWDGSGNASLATTMNNGSLDDQYVTVGSRHQGNGSALSAANKASIRIWDVSEATDDPSGSTDGLVLTAGWDSDSWAVQQYHDFHSNDLYLRSKQSGTWMTTWDRVFHDTYHPNADTLTTARTISLGGDLSGSASFNGSSNITITAAVADDSHNHVISNVDGLQTALDAKQASGTYNTIIGTDSDINTSGATVVDQLNMTDGVITSHSTRTLTLANLGYTGATNANNYSLPEATATARGGIELFSNTDQSVAANSVSSTAGRTYGIQLNSAGQAVVNVPWSDTNTDTNTTYTAGSGLTLSGTEFSHSDTSSQSSSANSGRTYIQSINLDGQGHVTGISTATETVTNTDTTYTAGRGLDLLYGTEFQLETDLRDSISHIGFDGSDYIQWSNNSYFRSVVSGTERFRVNTSGIDVNGTATASGFQTDTSNTSYNLITRNSTSGTLYVQAAQSNSLQTIASFRYGSATVNQGTETFRIRRDNVNVFGANFTVGGSITGNSKNFSIPHPTKEGKRLVHSCLEGPEIGVYFRGRSTSATIEMPDYWDGLVHLDSMTVELTAVGPNQDLYVASIADDGDVSVGSNTDTPLNYFYVIYGERKDLERLEVEIDDTVEVEEPSENSEEP